MFELHTSFELLSSLSQFIFSYRQSLEITESLIITPRIINQEKGGAILFVWNDVDKEKSSAYVTYFGIYEPETQKSSVVYTYDKKVKVVSYTINQERTLLAFSIVKPKEVSSERKSKGIYQAYLAELQSVEKIVFSLNMERSTFLKVQFLYPEQQRQSSNRESKMLVFLHKESIGLYKVSMARIGDRGIMMSGQPKTEQIVRKFVWCQWDVQQQHLHYIQNVRVDSSSDSVRQKMSTIQFYSKGNFENVIDIPINFQFPFIRTADKPHYADIPLHPGIPEITLNVSVLTQSSGTFCLCYHKLITDSKSKSQASPDCQDVEYYISLVHHAKTLYGCVSNLPKHVVMQKRLVFSWLGSYLVVMLPGCFVHLLNVGPNFEPCHHILLHDYKITPGWVSEVNSDRPTSVKFGFEDSGDQASLAGNSSSAASFASSQLERSVSSRSSPMVIPVFSEQCGVMKTLLPCQSFVRESGSTAQHLYDYRCGCLMKLVMNIDLMLESFRNAYWQTRLAILHYLILHNKDFFAVRKLFEVLSENLTNPEVNSMFTEYLVTSTFAEMKKQVDREVLNLLSFTSVQTLRGQFEKGSGGERIAHISYIPLEIIDLNKQLSKEQKTRSKEDFWDVLIRRLRLKLRSAVPIPRFSHDSVMRTYRQTGMEEVAGKTIWDPMHVDDSFFDGINTMKLREGSSSGARKSSSDSSPWEKPSGMRSKTDIVLGPSPLFLQTRSTQQSKIFKRRLSMLTESLLTKHLSKYLSKESQSKAKNVAKEYLYCQAKVSRQLCHLIWSLCNHQMSHHMEECLLPNLAEPGTDEDYELFQLYERFYLTAGDLGYPLPPGFSSFFTALGFKCLELNLFFQYVDNHILVLTPDFILQLLEDLPDDANEEIPRIKFQVIARLPKPFAEECFERWNHPIVQERKARKQAAEILKLDPLDYQTRMAQPNSGQGRDFDNPKKDASGRLGGASSIDKVTFPPLDTFMKHLDTLVYTSPPTNRPISYDADLIERTALHHTRTKTSFDLSTVNF